MVHTLLSSQDELRADPRTTLFRVGNGVGLSNDRIQACITDEAALKAADDRAKAASAAGVTGTPTFFVNGEMLVQPSTEQVEARVQAAVAAKGK